MGWALGAILYEINGYPWVLETPGGGVVNGSGDDSWWMLLLAAILGTC